LTCFRCRQPTASRKGSLCWRPWPPACRWCSPTTGPFPRCWRRLAAAYCTGALLDAKPTRPTQGTFGQMEFNVLCGKPQKLFVNKVMDMDALGLVFIYKGFLK